MTRLGDKMLVGVGEFRAQFPPGQSYQASQTVTFPLIASSPYIPDKSTLGFRSTLCFPAPPIIPAKIAFRPPPRGRISDCLEWDCAWLHGVSTPRLAFG